MVVADAPRGLNLIRLHRRFGDDVGVLGTGEIKKTGPV
jgi:hypothetical protein